MLQYQLDIRWPIRNAYYLADNCNMHVIYTCVHLWQINFGERFFSCQKAKYRYLNNQRKFKETDKIFENSS